jgi:hypothetical protein
LGGGDGGEEEGGWKLENCIGGALMSKCRRE